MTNTIMNSQIQIDHRDLQKDTTVNIQLKKAHEYLKNKSSKKVIIAVLDSEIDINHEDLKKKIWINKNEIKSNGIDDDKNGYIDDAHGWNFLGRKNNDSSIIYANPESLRLIRKYKKDSIDDIVVSENFKNDYLAAVKSYSEDLKSAKDRMEYSHRLHNGYMEAEKILKPLINDGEINIETIQNIKTEDTLITKHKNFMLNILKYKLTKDWIKNFKTERDSIFHLSANKDYNERKAIGDNPRDISNIQYGNNNISQNLEQQIHGTKIASVIAAIRDNNLGINGILDNVEIMPLVISPFGDEHDKDIALAIRYAADNGAKVINMSFSKPFSLYQEWVSDAIKYAQNKNVILITSAGNSGQNLDLPNYKYYPSDQMTLTGEQAQNFLVVGSVSNKIGPKLLSSFSNYGKQDVDLFAPSEEMKIAKPFNKYDLDKGTSISAAVVSGIAGLLFSYYPELMAPQVKKILLESTTKYDLEVEVEQEDSEKKLVPFSDLSKSGGIVNAYNALLMAEKLSKK